MLNNYLFLKIGEMYFRKLTIISMTLKKNKDLLIVNLVQTV